MNLIPLALVCAAVLPVMSSAALAESWQAVSPDGALAITVQPAGDGALTYNVRRGQTAIIGDSPLGITLTGPDGDFTHGLRFTARSRRHVRDRFVLLGGKAHNCSAAGNETTLTFRNPAGRDLRIVLRAYNDGAAFRYELPGTGDASVTGESSAFRIAPGTRGWVAPYVSYYEEFYPEGQVGRDFTHGDLALPALFDVGSGQFALLTESGVAGGYCSSHLSGSPDGLFHLVYPDAVVSGTLPWAAPWRVIITGSLGQVVESTLVDALAPPAVPGDTSWIKPGRVAWSWWSQDTRDLALQKHYVDFAHEMGWEYNLVDAGWIGWNNHDPGPQIVELVNYARPLGVGITLWAHYQDLDTPEKRAARIPLWKSWGIKGIKVDFFNSDSEATMKIREAILKMAWDNQLVVDFHGDQSPRGQDRTWPHFLTREGVRGAEYYKFGPFPTPAYNCTLPYTRNVPGPMDYTPVTFSTRNRTTTAAHELSLSVVFQSGLQHFADSPESYDARPLAKEFLKEVPAAWDETRFLDGYPAQFACLARRSGKTWFVGMNNAGTARSLTIPLRFLGGGRYQLDLYHDGAAPDSLAKETSILRQRDSIRVDVPANGGFVARLLPLGE